MPQIQLPVVQFRRNCGRRFSRRDYSTFNAVTHVIFDMDGLLLDTERLYSVAIGRITERFGHEFTWDIKQRTLGLFVRNTAQLLIDVMNLPICVDEFVSEWERNCKELLPTCNLLPGVARFLKHLDTYNIPYAIGTSSTKDNLILKTQNHEEIFNRFHHVVVGTDVLNGKPAPDIFLRASELFDDSPKPSDCLVFEDSPSGVEAALAAGMQVVMVPDERMALEKTDRATLAIDSFELFKPEVFGLPPFVRSISAASQDFGSNPNLRYY